MLILGIESSCDETAVALVEDGCRILCSHISSQIALHQPYGGVVPELASRSHLEQLNPLLDLALSTAGCTYEDIDAIAATIGPGLQGALMVGFTAAKTLSWLCQKPLLGVHHLEGHIYSAFLGTGQIPQFPLLLLLVSGGHTQLLSVAGHGQYEIVANTRDDAVGEAFDKVARMLGLSYPGGPAIDQAAQSGDPQAFSFPIAMRHQADFSFSGLKTALLYTIRELEAQNKPLPIADLCASFQRVAIESLMLKLIRHLKNDNYKQVAIVGGVSANSYLRKQLQQLSEQQHCQYFNPPLKFVYRQCRHDSSSRLLPAALLSRTALISARSQTPFASSGLIVGYFSQLGNQYRAWLSRITDLGNIVRPILIPRNHALS